jgi:monoamine oxidase
MPSPIISATQPRSALDADVIVVGGGLAGLTTATLLREAGHRVILLEAKRESGGRICSVRDSETGHYLADLGPTWVWPAYQPIISRWLDRLALTVIPQFDQGQVIAEMSRDAPPVTTRLPGQDGSVRIIGGPQALVDALTANLPTDIVHKNARVTDISIETDCVMVTLDERTISSRNIVVSVPPRIALETISWQPELPTVLREALSDLPTWMAPHAKVVALYEKPFWRTRGLSGRIVSRVGPLVEVHDHSGPDGVPAALFGFVGWPHDMRAELAGGLEGHVLAQLARCFGLDAPAPVNIQIKDWAADRLVTVDADLKRLGGHPEVGPEIIRQPHFDGKLYFATAETATQSPGLIEGAFVAAEHAAKAIGALN